MRGRSGGVGTDAVAGVREERAPVVVDARGGVLQLEGDRQRCSGGVRRGGGAPVAGSR
jgi:hypothetical protein